MTQLKFTALLPMKKHSIRVSGKNVRNFSGAPLYTYILNTLIDLDWINKIIINTDSKEILESAQTLSPKIKIHLREESLIGDDVSMNRIIESDLKKVKDNFFLQTHATNPLISAKTLVQAKDMFLDHVKSEKYDSLFSVNQLQSRLYDSRIIPINHDLKYLIPTQDLSPIYEENSCFYFFSRDSFLRSGARIGTSPAIFPVPKNEAFDIDTEEDFKLAEMMMNYRKSLGQQY